MSSGSEARIRLKGLKISSTLNNAIVKKKKVNGKLTLKPEHDAVDWPVDLSPFVRYGFQQRETGTREAALLLRDICDEFGTDIALKKPRARGDEDGLNIGARCGSWRSGDKVGMPDWAWRPEIKHM